MIIKFVKIECERNTSQGDGLLSAKYVGEGSVQLTLSREFLTSRVSWGSWKLFLIYENLFFMWMGVLLACTSVHQCIWYPQMALDPLELEWQMVVNQYVGAVNRIQVLWKKSQCS